MSSTSVSSTSAGSVVGGATSPSAALASLLVEAALCSLPTLGTALYGAFCGVGLFLTTSGTARTGGPATLILAPR